MTTSPSAERERPRPRPRRLPPASLASGLALVLLAPLPTMAGEVLDNRDLGAARLSAPAELLLPAEATVDTTGGLSATDLDGALPEPAAGPADAAMAPEVKVRAGSHPTFQRFVFDWPHDVAVVTEQTGDVVVVRFATAAQFRPDGSVPAGQIDVRQPETVTIRATDIVEVESFSLADHRVVVDLYPARLHEPRADEPAD